jgi:hypothetical protein
MRIFSLAASKSSRRRAATPSFSREAEQDVLGADAIVAQSASLLLCQDDHLARSLYKPLEHAA